MRTKKAKSYGKGRTKKCKINKDGTRHDLRRRQTFLPTSWLYEAFMHIVRRVGGAVIDVRHTTLTSELWETFICSSLQLFTYPEFLSPYVSIFASHTETYNSSFSTPNSAHSTRNISSQNVFDVRYRPDPTAEQCAGQKQITVSVATQGQSCSCRPLSILAQRARLTK